MRANRESGEHGTENASSCSGPNGEEVVTNAKGAVKEAGGPDFGEAYLDAHPLTARINGFRTANEVAAAEVTCKTCDGRGWLQGVIGGCPACGGVGRVPARKPTVAEKAGP